MAPLAEPNGQGEDDNVGLRTSEDWGYCRSGLGGARKLTNLRLGASR